MSETTRLSPPPHLTVKTLAVSVLEGPDAGKSADADSEVLSVGSAQGNDLVLSDESVSGYHLELGICPQGICVTDLGSTNGTKLGTTLLSRATVAADSVLTLGHTKLKLQDGAGAVVALHDGLELRGLVGQSEVMRRTMAQINKLSQNNIAVLLVGESGTGKEVVARAIHELSPRASKPFVTIDCGAFSPNLVASELFGHERGAFTGADRQHIGAFERAHGGTVFLDEIGELPLELQPQLLGTLERRRFRRLGGQTEIDVDVKLVSATNRELRQAVNEGQFRLDLYYRIAVAVLKLPALRERPDDVPLLIAHFLRECGHDGPIQQIVSADVMGSLQRHRWPGNVRELRNWVEVTIAMGEAGGLEGDEAAPSLRGASADMLSELPYKEARNQVLYDFEHRYFGRLLEACGHNVSEVARRARMDRSYLIKLLQRHDLR